MNQHASSHIPKKIKYRVTRTAVEKVKPRKRQAYRETLIRQANDLLWCMPAPYRALLFKIGAEVIVNADRHCFGSSERANKRFFIRANLLDGFHIKQGSMIGSRQKARFAYSTVIEEVIHYFDDYLNFSETRNIKTALKKDIDNPNPLQEQLFLLERRSSAVRGRKKKFFVRQYEPEQQPCEMLVDVILIGYCLYGMGLPQNQIERIMDCAFPHSWPVAKFFQASVAMKAGYPPSSHACGFRGEQDDMFTQCIPTLPQQRALNRVRQLAQKQRNTAQSALLQAVA